MRLNDIPEKTEIRDPKLKDVLANVKIKEPSLENRRTVTLTSTTLRTKDSHSRSCLEIVNTH